MFDANMRYLPKGLEFFAEAWSIDKEGKLHELGYKDGDLILCKMMSKGHINPAIMVDGIQVTNNEGFYDTTLIYTGCADGSGFIDDTVRNKALQVLDGKWKAGNV